MTKKTIKRWFVSTVGCFVLLIGIGIGISVFDQTEKRVVFTTFKDLMPLAIAIAAAWLGFCVQRRSAYLQQLRSLWSKLIEAVQSAAQYTHSVKPSQEDFSKTLLKLSIAIDEIRGVFCNLGEGSKDVGLFPFEPIKTIYELVADLGFGDNFKAADAPATRNNIVHLWKEMRRELLKEFDREEPTWPHSHWNDSEKAKTYDALGILKK